MLKKSKKSGRQRPHSVSRAKGNGGCDSQLLHLPSLPSLCLGELPAVLDQLELACPSCFQRQSVHSWRISLFECPVCENCAAVTFVSLPDGHISARRPAEFQLLFRALHGRLLLVQSSN